MSVFNYISKGCFLIWRYVEDEKNFEMFNDQLFFTYLCWIHIFVSTFEDLVTFFGLFFIVFLRDVLGMFQTTIRTRHPCRRQ